MISSIRPVARLCDAAEVYFTLSALLVVASLVNGVALFAHL